MGQINITHLRARNRVGVPHFGSKVRRRFGPAKARGRTWQSARPESKGLECTGQSGSLPVHAHFCLRVSLISAGLRTCRKRPGQALSPRSNYIVPIPSLEVGICAHKARHKLGRCHPEPTGPVSQHGAIFFIILNLSSRLSYLQLCYRTVYIKIKTALFSKH